ncbi:MAG: hypothetical protein ACK4SM_02560 [Aquificaceae bacterium]
MILFLWEWLTYPNHTINHSYIVRDRSLTEWQRIDRKGRYLLLGFLTQPHNFQDDIFTTTHYQLITPFSNTLIFFWSG